MRASILMLGPLLGRFGKAFVPLPGGCSIGLRPVDLHMNVLRALGANISLKDGDIQATTTQGRLVGTQFRFEKITVCGTVNGILAAVLAQGETVLMNCAYEPEISNLCSCLLKMGAQIDGHGTRTIRIVGVESLNETTEFRIMPDRLEAATMMVAAAITKGNLNVLGVEYEHIEAICEKMIQVGVSVTKVTNGINVQRAGQLKANYLETDHFPGFPTDVQAAFMALVASAEGTSFIVENIFENRFHHVPELKRMGATIFVFGTTAVIQGVRGLSGTEVKGRDLRGAAALVLAALGANGKTTVHGIHYLDRGYESLEVKLNQCGAEIVRIKHS